MCGIAGLLLHRTDALPGGDIAAVVRKMGRAVAHRGPDAASEWTDGKQVALAHRRLSIIDLSPAGTQPMTSADGKWVMVYNGETYNYLDLREELEGKHSIAWRSTSDSEVVLEAIAQLGFATAVEKFNGMFAIAALHRPSGKLYLARDRLGQKPLYYTATDDFFLFGSELRTLMAYPQFQREIDNDALAAYLQLGYLPRDSTIFKNTKKLLPGHWMVTDVNGEMRQERYWDLRRIASAGVAGRPGAHQEQPIEDLLADAVRLRLVADVPVGCLLSGGIDSSLIAALAVQARQNAAEIHTFCVGFDEQAYDESEHAARIAKALGTRHTTFRLRASEALESVKELPRIYDEPFADSSQLPTYLISRCAREQVKVVLTGDGGDELFIGYTRYFRKLRQLRMLGRVPDRLRPATGGALDGLARLSLRAPHLRRLADPLDRCAELLRSPDLTTAYWRSLAITPDTGRFLRHEARPPRIPDIDGVTGIRAFALIDQLTYLPEDILCKLDRASMAVGLEARNPLLDFRLAEATWRLSEAQHLEPHGPKSVLKKVLFDLVPQSLLERPKAGFAVPVATWLRGPLKQWADDLLQLPTVLLDDAAVLVHWRELLAGADRNERLIWAVLMLKAWAREYAVEI